MVKIRQAVIDDLEAIRKLNTKIFVKNPQYDDDAVLNFALTPRGKKYFKEAIERKNGCFFIAEENGQMVGYANGGKMDISYRKSRYFEIDNLGVIPERKKQGIGSLLLKVITKWARDKNYEKIYLNCYAKNQEALGFYRHQGYQDIDACLEKKIS